MKELDIRDVFRIIFKRLWLIILAVAVAFLLGGYYTYFMVIPQYEAMTTMYVGRTLTGGADAETAIYQELLVGEKLVNDYRELVKSRQVAELVISRAFTSSPLTVEDITRIVEVTSKANTRVIEISAKHRDPATAATIANLTAEVFAERAVAIMDVENVQIIDTAVAPQDPVVPNKPMNLLISCAIGLMLGVGLAFLLEFLDNKIRTPEDVEAILGLPVLGTILSLDSEKKFNKKAFENAETGGAK